MTAPSTQRSPHRLRDSFRLAGYGFCMGSADIVPGVSGGTMAFILGIYEDLINAINAVNSGFVRRLLTFHLRDAFSEFPWRFVVSLLTGIVIAIFTLAEGLRWALNHHPDLLWAFFFGLVIASVFTVRRRVSRWNPDKIIITALTSVAMYFLMGIMPQQTPDSYWFVMLCGAIAICAMILPGISGAFLLVLLGKYHHMLDAVADLDLLTLGVFVVGAAGGLLLFARLLRQMLIHQRDRTLAALIGLMLGSVAKIWPWKEPINEANSEGIEEIVKMQGSNVLPDAFTLEVGLAIALAVFGFGIVLVLEHLAERHSSEK